jgi:TonB family protein
MKTKLLLSILFFAKVLFAQEIEENKIYLDSLFKTTKSIESPYYLIVEDNEMVKDDYKFKIFYKSGKLFKEGLSRSTTNLVEKGLITTYFENGNKKEEYTIDQSGIIGIKTGWYENGKTKYIKEYFKSTKKILPEIKIIQFWDKDNNQKIIDGNGFFEDVENQCHEKGMIKNGLRTGKWEGEDQLNSFAITFKEEYDNGKLIKGVSTDKMNIEYSYTEVNEAPKPSKGYDHFYKYIGKKFKMSKKLEATGGKVILSFVIEKNGSISDVKVLRSAGIEFDTESMRLVKEYPDWEPGKYRGLKARVHYSLPITIRPSE